MRYSLRLQGVLTVEFQAIVQMLGCETARVILLTFALATSGPTSAKLS